MANVSDFVVVASWAWSMLLLFVALTLAVLWGCYWWRKYWSYAAKKQAKRIETLKELCKIERHVGYRRA